jgi:hypothetical protein
MRPRVEVSSFSPLSIDGGVLKRERSAVCVTVENYLRSTGVRILRVSVCSPCSLHVLHVVFLPILLPGRKRGDSGFPPNGTRLLSSNGTANVRFCVSFFPPSTFCYSCEPAGNSDKDSSDVSCRDAERNFRMSIRCGRMRYSHDFVRSCLGQPISNVVS